MLGKEHNRTRRSSYLPPSRAQAMLGNEVLIVNKFTSLQLFFSLREGGHGEWRHGEGEHGDMNTCNYSVELFFFLFYSPIFFCPVRCFSLALNRKVWRFSFSLDALAATGLEQRMCSTVLNPHAFFFSYFPITFHSTLLPTKFLAIPLHETKGPRSLSLSVALSPGECNCNECSAALAHPPFVI